MPTEIEAKMKVDSHAPIRRRLTELGAQQQGRYLETDRFFDRPDGSLFAKDHGLRVRHSRPLEGTEVISTLTFKGARHPGAFKARKETELTIGDAETACEMLRSLGFQQVLTFEKWRERWKLAGCLVALDELPLLGCFVEIEGVSEGAVQAVREQLAMTAMDPLKHSYVGLLFEKLTEEGMSTREVRFQEQ